MLKSLMLALGGALLSIGAANAAARASKPAPAPIDYFARDTFETETIVCPFKGEIAYKAGEISCGLLTVPENREKPDSRRIQLHFVKLAARKPLLWDAKARGEWKRREDPIVYLTGGPGAVVTHYVQALKDHGARDVRDVYILEQRGIGYSDDFCPLYALVDPKAQNAFDRKAQQDAAVKLSEDCFKAAAAHGVDLAGYNTIENARDVEALRRTLGFAQWNVWGISYGSYLGQAYLKQDPAGVRAAVIDAIVPFQQDVQFLEIATHYQRDLDLLDKACAANEICAKNFKNSSDRLKAAMGAVDKAPITVDAIDTERFPSGKATFFADFVGGLPFSLLYEQKNYATLPAMIDAFADLIAKKDYSALRALTVGSGGGGDDILISQGMYAAIACNDGWSQGLEQAIKNDHAKNPVLALMQGDPEHAAAAAALCLKYGMTPRSAEQYSPLVTDIPMIVADGQMDPITPPPLAKAILGGLKNVTYVEFPYAGHGPTRSVKCAGDFLTKFYDNPKGKVDTKCADDMKAPDFVGPLFKTQGLLKLTIAAASDPKAGAMLMAWFGLSAIVLLIGAVIYTLAPMARGLNGDESVSTGGARPLAWLVSVLGAAAVLGLGAGLAMTTSQNAALVLFGLLGWAKWFAYAGLAAGGFGALLLPISLAARVRDPLPIGTLLGLLLTAFAGVGLGGFLYLNGFSPI